MRRLLGGALAYVRPTFMLPVVGMSVYSALLAPAPAFNPVLSAVHAGAVGIALFVAHLRDGYVDGHRRGEETPRLTVSEFRWGIRAGSAVLVALAGVLLLAADPIAALSVLAVLALALLHAPYLDRYPVTVTVDYPVGIGVTIAGGYATQTGGVALEVLGVATVFVGLLSGIKIGIDSLDASFDRSIGKRTVPVVLGEDRAARVAILVFGATAIATIGAVGSVAERPSFALLAASVPIGCLLATVVASTERAVRIQMALTYVFAAALFLSACGGQCAGGAFGSRLLELSASDPGYISEHIGQKARNTLG